MSSLANALMVQCFKRLPGLRSAWGRRHRFVENHDTPWTPLAKPLRECSVALVTTAGVHLKSQEPFDMNDRDGDPSFRAIPSDAQREALTITHNYYDHSAADRDLNVVLPLDRLRECAAERRIGGLAPFVYGFMGHITGRHLGPLMHTTAPEAARRLALDGAEAVLLTPA